MNQNIEKILQELYDLDPSFKDHEKDLIRIIEQLIENKPDTFFTNDFKNSLLKEIQSEIKSIQKPKFNFNLNFMKKYIGTSITVALVAIVFVGALFYTNKDFSTEEVSTSDSNTRIEESLLGGEIEITENSKNNAFGDFKLNSESQQEAGMGGGGAGYGEDAAAMSSSRIAPYPYPGSGGLKNYIYTIAGNLPELPNEIEILKKMNLSDKLVEGNKFLEKISLGVMDKSVLEDAKVQSFSLFEDKKNGYNFNINLDQAQLSINKQWNLWEPHPRSKCQNRECFDRYRIKEEDLLEDEELIEIAQDFLSEYKISLKNYGDPIVRNDWIIQYQRSQDKSNFYFPENMSVQYPMVINGYEIYDQYGNVMGMNVSIDLFEKKVTGVYGIETPAFESSKYPVENMDKIQEIVKTGGYKGYNISGPNVEDVEIKIENPKMIYMNFWRYLDNQSEQYLIPAIKFDINAPEEETQFDYRNTLVIPLLKDMYEFENVAKNNPPEIMPMVR